MTPAYVDARQAAAFLGVGIRNFHNLRHDPSFPAALAFGQRSTRWKVAELEAWADTQRATAKRPEPASLIAAKATKRGTDRGRSGGTKNPTAVDPRPSTALAERPSAELKKSNSGKVAK